MNTLTHAATMFRDEVAHEVNAVVLDAQDTRLEGTVEWLLALVEDVADQMIEEAKYSGAHLRDQVFVELRSMFPHLSVEDALEGTASLRAGVANALPLRAGELTSVDVSARLAGHVPTEVGIPAAPSMARYTKLWSDSMIPHVEIAQEIAEVQNFDADLDPKLRLVLAPEPQDKITRPHCATHGGFARNSDGKCAKCDTQVSPTGDVQKLLDALAKHFQSEAVEVAEPVKAARKAFSAQAVTKTTTLRYAMRAKGEVARRSLYAMSKITGDPVTDMPISRDGFAAYAKTHGIVLEEVPVSSL